MKKLLAGLLCAASLIPSFSALAQTSSLTGSGGGGLTAGSAIPCVYNLTPLSLPNLHRKLGGLKQAGGLPNASGAANLSIAFEGDSTWAGHKAAYAGTDSVALAVPAAFVKILNAAGFPAENDSVWGDHALSAGADPLVTLGTNWSYATPQQLGGQPPKWASTTGAYTYAPANAWDTVDIYFLCGFAGSVGVVIGSGASQTATIPSTPTNLCKQTFTSGVAPAVQNLTVNQISGSGWLVGVHTYSSLNPKISVYNWGTSSMPTSALVSSVYYDIAHEAAVVAPTALMDDVTINDWVAGTTAATWTANQVSFLNGFTSTTTDVVLVIGNPTQISSATQANQTIIINAAYALAAARNIPLIDYTCRYGSYNTATANGLTSDFAHMNTYGYGDEAYAVYAALFSQ